MSSGRQVRFCFFFVFFGWSPLHARTILTCLYFVLQKLDIGVAGFDILSSCLQFVELFMIWRGFKKICTFNISSLYLQFRLVSFLSCKCWVNTIITISNEFNLYERNAFMCTYCHLYFYHWNCMCIAWFTIENSYIGSF